MKIPWRRVLMVGGTGRMGLWFSRLFRDVSLEVTITSRNPSKGKQAAEKLNVKFASLKNLNLKSYDLVFLSTPISVTASLIRKLAQGMAEGSTITEIASIKGDIGRALAEAYRRHGVKAVSLHPMFGPGAESIKGQRVIVIPIRGCMDTAETMEGFLSSLGGVVLRVKSFREHDRLMAFVLSLPHMLNMLFAGGLRLSGLPVEELSRFGGTTFRLQKLICESLFHEDVETFAAIQGLNPEFARVVSRLEAEVKRLKAAVERGETAYFKRAYRRILRFLTCDPEYRQAYERFYWALKAAG